MCSTPSWLFIANPLSGKGQTSSRIEALFQKVLECSPESSLVLTDAPLHAKEIARAAYEEGVRHFAVIGGDGTLNEVINGIFSCDELASDCQLAVVPWGTGNDWSAYYGIPASDEAWIEMFRQGNTCKQDIGKVVYKNDQNIEQNHYFINFVGSGFDTYVLEQMGSGRGKRSRYYYYLVKSLFSYQGRKLSVQSPDNIISHYGLLNMVCLGKFGGAGMIFAPEAKMDDGLFDVVSLQDMPVCQRILSLPYLMNGKVNQHKKVTAFQAESLQMDIQGGSVFQCDGEIIGQLPAQISLLPCALKVLVP